MFWMSVEDFGFVLKHIDDIICPKEMNAGNRPILSDERLTFTIRSLATGKSFQSLSFRFWFSLSAVLYIIERCCYAIAEWFVPLFVKIPAFPA